MWRVQDFPSVCLSGRYSLSFDAVGIIQSPTDLTSLLLDIVLKVRPQNLTLSILYRELNLFAPERDTQTNWERIMAEWPSGYETGNGPTAEESPVLVAVINNLHDFEIASQQGWYRIPVKRVPRRLGAEFLAFYQTKVFGEESWAVNYYAAIRRVHLVQRLDLLPEQSDHPRATDWYYRIEIGSLQRLPHPIPSRRLRRITFIPTTFSRLLSAWEINDLWLGSEEEEQLWEVFKQNEIEVERRVSLRESSEVFRSENLSRCSISSIEPSVETLKPMSSGSNEVSRCAKTSQDLAFQVDTLDEDYLIDFAAYCRQSKVAILCESYRPLGEGSALRERPSADYELGAVGWEVLRFSSQQIETSVEDCLALVRDVIAKAGGLEEPPASR